MAITKTGAMRGMWKCPRCQRVVSRQHQDHYCIKPQNIDEYIAAQSEALKPKLNELRDIIRSAIPDAEERIFWPMPTYWKGKNLLHFAASKKHLGFYSGDEAVARFSEELAGFAVSKGTIRLPYDTELPAELIRRIARWCDETYGIPSSEITERKRN